MGWGGGGGGGATQGSELWEKTKVEKGEENKCVRRHIQLPGGVGGEKRVLLRKVYGGGVGVVATV